MRFSTVLFISLLAANVQAQGARAIPKRIVCIPSEYGTLNSSAVTSPNMRPEAHLFEHKGKIKVVRESESSFRYIYDGSGVDHFDVKEKLSLHGTPIVIGGPHLMGRHVDSDTLVIKSIWDETYFRIDLNSKKYYGFKLRSEDIQTFGGTCTFER
ncbi:MAG: hypothetical protein PSV26_02895 [Polaromonas sp.]|uniref:hypothetical protein n=1 Tax=Polaromonas sp. TaxID=1869339 RepID=UPI002489A421|nr:hypothetical protein [Polaromonas sp.]MDI1236413.1 hypothetical protein [Polaromonas sp.]